MPGLFIVFEGPDGAGTTTHAALLRDHLEREGRDVLLTAEPSDGPIGRMIREELKGASPPSPKDLQRFFAEDRAWHIDEVITPALVAGKTVICDRYIPSTLVYGSVQGVPLLELKSMNKDFIRPDILLLLLPSFEVCFSRIEKRKQKDLFETKDFQKKIHIAYEAMAKGNDAIHVIDTSEDKEKVALYILDIVQNSFSSNSARAAGSLRSVRISISG